MSELTITQEVFTGLVFIRLADDITTQAMVLTPAEYDQLRVAVKGYKPDGLGDAAREREATTLRRLTIYNGHSLPSIVRPAFEESQRFVGPPFYFELHQLTYENGQIIDKVVAKL